MITIGDTIYAATDFGISLINPNDLTFYDTYFKYGNLSAYIPVNSITITNKIYACTGQGVVIQKEGSHNLSAPDSWEVYNTSSGLPSNVTYKIVSYNGTIIVSTQSGLAEFNGTSWTNFLPQLTGSISDLISNGDSLVFSSGKQIYSYRNGNLNVLYNSQIDVTKLEIFNGNELLAATANGVMNSNSGKLLYPNGPQANQFPALSIDNDGNLWSASGKDGAGVGFYKYDGQKWTNYTKSNSIISNNDYFFVYSAPDNSTYVGNWGAGFAKIKDDNISIFNTSNTDLLGTPENPDSHKFLVISGFASDSKNNLWILNYWASDRNILSVLTKDSSWYYFNDTAARRVLEQQYSLVIDPYDTKWYYSQDPSQLGVFYFNENNTLDDPNDDVSGNLTASDGLNTNTITSLVVDRRGDVWVGTSLGVNVITQTYTIASSNKPQLAISSIFALRQQSINCMAVDPLNQKWIGTNEGLLHVTSDGNTLLEAFTSKNSPLLSDIIKSIAIDPNTGTVYVGTDEGLTSFVTTSVMPKESFDQLLIYPNPFILKNGGKYLTIDGLIRDSDIKVLTINGKLVAEFSSPGGRIATWDGRDLNGNFVSSGIYLVVAYDKDGNNVTTSKVAILHE